MTPFHDPTRIATLLADYPGKWWICGGWAIDLFLNQETRPHKDVDIAIPRQEQLFLQAYLLGRGWILQQAIDGQLLPWDAGEFLYLPTHTIWCRHPQHVPPFLEILLNEIDDDYFSFRKDQTIRRPHAQMALRTADGVPILAPEIVLLYKASSADEAENTHDFLTAWPRMHREQQQWLDSALLRMYGDHPWLERGDRSRNNAA